MYATDISLLETLPQEMLFTILMNLSVEDLLKITSLNKNFLKYKNDQNLWRGKFEQCFPTYFC